MTIVLDWEDAKPWLLNWLCSITSLLFVSHGLLRPIRARKLSRQQDVELVVDVEQGTGGLVEHSTGRGKEFLRLVKQLVGDQETAETLSQEWIDAVRVSGARLNVEEVKEQLVGWDGSQEVLVKEASDLVKRVIEGCRSEKRTRDGQQVVMPTPFAKYGVRLVRMEALVAEVEKGGYLWRSMEGYEARWLGVAQIYILVTAFELNTVDQIDWLALLDSATGFAALLLSYYTKPEFWTFVVFTRGLVTVLPCFERCKLARKTVQDIWDYSDGSCCKVRQALVLASEIWIFLAYWLLVALNLLLVVVTIWPFIWLPFMFWAIAPLAGSGWFCIPSFLKSSQTEGEESGSGPSASKGNSTSPDNGSEDVPKSFENQLDILDAGISFTVAQNCVLSQVRTGWASRLASITQQRQGSTGRIIFNLMLYFVIVPQAVEVACIAGLNAYGGHEYWESFIGAVHIGSFASWVEKSVPTFILELL